MKDTIWLSVITDENKPMLTKQLAKKNGCTLESLKSACFFNYSLDIEDKKILMIGHGGIGNNMISLFKKHLKFKPGNILVYDAKPEVLPGDYVDGIYYKNLKNTLQPYTFSFLGQEPVNGYLFLSDHFGVVACFSEM